MTPLQMARAVAAIANGGRLPEPFVVTAIDDERAPARRRAAGSVRAISAPVADELTRMLRAVVTEGTGSRARLPGYSVAGKTGTAQKVVDGTYSPTRFVASFAGFAPATAPRLAGIVVLDEPGPAYHGGEVAAPVFASMAREILLYWGVPRDREEVQEPPPAPDPPSSDRPNRSSSVVRASLASSSPASSAAGGLP